jgi:hypothetical protein
MIRVDLPAPIRLPRLRSAAGAAGAPGNAVAVSTGLTPEDRVAIGARLGGVITDPIRTTDLVFEMDNGSFSVMSRDELTGLLAKMVEAREEPEVAAMALPTTEAAWVALAERVIGELGALTAEQLPVALSQVEA